ncbi:MAG: branched-chain amino acid ABC transporter permease [Myxococcota bacterium]
MQLVLNGLAAGFAYGLIAVGFSVIYAGCRFFHVAHAGVYAAGAYAAYASIELLGASLVVALVAGVVAAAGVGALMELLVYKPLRDRGASALVLLVASLGLFVLVQNGLSLGFGDDVKVLRTGSVDEGLALLGGRLTVGQVLVIAAGAAVYTLVWSVLRFTRTGRTYRAVMSDRELAAVHGVPVDRVLLIVMVAGSALAGLAGILVGYDLDLRPRMGFQALLMGIVATVVGGLGSIAGAMLGGLVVGMAQHVSAWFLPTQWQYAVTLSVLFLVLMVRREGLLGRSLPPGRA